MILSSIVSTTAGTFLNFCSCRETQTFSTLVLYSAGIEAFTKQCPDLGLGGKSVAERALWSSLILLSAVRRDMGLEHSLVKRL